MPDTEISRVHDKLDRLAEGLARLSALEERSAQILPRLEAVIQDHETRLGKVEQHNWERIDGRIDELEKWKGTIKGWIAGATAVVTVVGGVVLWYLNHVLETLPT